jgi:hypothetical protein
MNLVHIYDNAFNVFQITPFPVSPKGEMINSDTFPRGGRQGSG